MQSKAVEIDARTDESQHQNLTKLNDRLRLIEDNILKLANQLDKTVLENIHLADDENHIKKQFILTYLRKLGLKGAFCRQFAGNLLKAKKSQDIDESVIENALGKYIKVEKVELIDERKICALIGPTELVKPRLLPN